MNMMEIIHGYKINSNSVGFTGDLGKFNKSRYTNDTGVYESIVNFLLTPMSKVEENNRVAELLYYIENGSLKSEAYKHIAHSQFDYSAKSRTTRILENFIPFLQFTTNNIMFWVDALESDPRLSRLLSDFYKCT